MGIPESFSVEGNSKESLLQVSLAFSFLETRGPLAFWLELPENLSLVHDVFHVSKPKQCFKQSEHAVVLRAIQLSADLFYPERLIRVLVTSQRKMRNKFVQFPEVQWSHHSQRDYIGV